MQYDNECKLGYISGTDHVHNHARWHGNNFTINIFTTPRLCWLGCRRRSALLPFHPENSVFSLFRECKIFSTNIIIFENFRQNHLHEFLHSGYMYVNVKKHCREGSSSNSAAAAQLITWSVSIAPVRLAMPRYRPLTTISWIFYRLQQLTQSSFHPTRKFGEMTAKSELKRNPPPPEQLEFQTVRSWSAVVSLACSTVTPKRVINRRNG